MNYSELKEIFYQNSTSSNDYKDFQERLAASKTPILGVRTPVLRRIAKELKGEYYAVRSFPDDCYEIRFIKLILGAQLPFEEFKSEVGYLVSIMDGWALTDCFKPNCVNENKREYLEIIEEYLNRDGEFEQRFALVSLLYFYVESEYLSVIFDAVLRSDNSKYYVHMASAWLIAEVLAKYYNEGYEFLKKGLLDKKTHNKALQKAKESFRLTKFEKEELKFLKRY